jgi:hypothetical protein
VAIKRTARGEHESPKSEHQRRKPGTRAEHDMPPLTDIVAFFFASVEQRKPQGWFAVGWRVRGAAFSGTPAERVCERGPFRTRAEAAAKAKTLQLLS